MLLKGLFFQGMTTKREALLSISQFENSNSLTIELLDECFA